MTQTAGGLHPNDHRALRWVRVHELQGLPWVPADRAWVGELTRVLRGSGVAVRRASEVDRSGVADIIARTYRREFSVLSRDVNRIAGALRHAVEIDRFFVAEQRADVVGAVACTDRTGRAMRIDNAEFRRRLGPVRGEFVARILKSQFMSRLHCSAATGYIEFLAVAEKARRQGIATKLVEGVIAKTAYADYQLEVIDGNMAARDCYAKIGFIEIARDKEKFARIKGFRERIYMRYIAG